MFKFIINKLLKISNDLAIKLLLSKIESLEEDVYELNIKVNILEELIKNADK